MIIAFTLGLFLLNWTPEAINSTLSRFFKQLNRMQFAINVSISKKESNGLKFIHLTTLYKDMLLLCYFIWRMVGTYFMACFAKKKKKRKGNGQNKIFKNHVSSCQFFSLDHGFVKAWREAAARVYRDSCWCCLTSTVPLCMSCEPNKLPLHLSTPYNAAS